MRFRAAKGVRKGVAVLACTSVMFAVAGCASTASESAVVHIDSLDDLREALSDAGYPCEGFDFVSDSQYGEEGGNCLGEVSITYCKDAVICARLMDNLRRNLASWREPILYAYGSNWIVGSNDAQEISEALNGKFIQFGGAESGATKVG